MKGLQPIFLGIFGIFGFSWLGLALVPQLQIGSLNPQSDEEGTDVYPLPQSGMVARGARVYAANGCFYCHSQQVRPEYGGSDLERGWGKRRSAPRDYIFEPIVMLGKMRNGPDLANVGARPEFVEKSAASPAPGASPAGSPAPGAGTPAGAPAGASPPPAASPALAGSPAAAGSPAPAAASASPVPASVAAAPAASPAAKTGSEATASPPAAAGNPAGPSAQPSPTMVTDASALAADGRPSPYTAAWHHRHLYNPRSISDDSNMPSYRFLYVKRRIGQSPSPNAVNFVGDESEGPAQGWEIVPSYDARCLVAYLMSRDQSHPLKEAKSPVVAAPAASPAKGAAAK